MKKLLWMASWLSLAFIAGLGRAYAAVDTTVMTWKLVEPGSYGATGVSFYFGADGLEADTFVVDWGDGTIEGTENFERDSLFGDKVFVAHHWYQYEDRDEEVFFTARLYAREPQAKLRRLAFDRTYLSALDVSQNVALEKLICYGNKLTALDVSKNVALDYLDCGANRLTALDVSRNVALRQLYCFENQLSSIDVSKNTALEVLYCYKNQLSALDVSQNVNLIYLSYVSNQLTAVDMSNNVALLYCWAGKNRLTSLDVSKNVNLVILGCPENELTELDLTSCAQLQEVDFSDNRLRSVTLAENARLKYLSGAGNRLRPSMVYDLMSHCVDSATSTFHPQIDSLYLTEGTCLDLTSEVMIDGEPSVYHLYDAWSLLAEDSVYKDEGGLIYFYKPGEHYELALRNNMLKDRRKGLEASNNIRFTWYIYVAGVANEDWAAFSAAPWAYVKGRTIYLTEPDGGAELGEVEAFTAVGQRVYRGYDRAFTVPTAGVYVLRAADGRRCKVMVR